MTSIMSILLILGGGGTTTPKEAGAAIPNNNKLLNAMCETSGVGVRKGVRDKAGRAGKKGTWTGGGRGGGGEDAEMIF